MIDEGARQAVETCLKVGDDDNVVIVTDVAKLDIGAALLDRVKRQTKNYHLMILEDLGTRPLKEIPKELADALDKATVSILAASSHDGEMAGLRKPMLEIIKKNHIRHAHMIGVTPEIMEQGMSADYEEIMAFSRKVYNLVREVHKIEVTTPKGTHLHVSVGKAPWIISDGSITRDTWTNLPDGEVWTIADNAEGMLVVDGVLGDHFSEKYGLLEQNPLILKIEHSRVTKVHTDNPTLLADFSRYIKKDENSGRIGEFALGTNLGLKSLIGNMLQDEKFPGVHIAVGHPFPERTGIEWASCVHCDAVIQHPTVIVDGKVLMKNGRYLI